jgi:hypothetical protein
VFNGISSERNKNEFDSRYKDNNDHTKLSALEILGKHLGTPVSFGTFYPL